MAKKLLFQRYWSRQARWNEALAFYEKRDAKVNYGVSWLIQQAAMIIQAVRHLFQSLHSLASINNVQLYLVNHDNIYNTVCPPCSHEIAVPTLPEAIPLLSYLVYGR